jgi:regulator of sigma E protease
MFKNTLMFITILIVIHFIILIHEGGHYIAARIFNIKVKTFSVGLGKTIYEFKSRSGVLWRFGMFPIGGYVVLLNTQIDKVSLSELKSSFNIKPLWQKIIVYAAGPLVNLIFAILIYIVLFINGMFEVKPNISKIIPDSIAAKSGMYAPTMITNISGNNVNTWRDVNIYLLSALGNKDNITISTKSNNNTNNYSLDINNWEIDTLSFNPVENIGLKAYVPPTPVVIDEIVAGSPADGKLKIGDKILKINNIDISNYEEFEDVMLNFANQEIILTVNSSNITKKVIVETSWTFKNGWDISGYLGIKPKFSAWPKDTLLLKKHNLYGALKEAIDATFIMLKFNFIVLGKVITRVIPAACLSGPIGFFSVAFASLNSGFSVFMEMIAIFNILLAFANLLPLPGLDGGNILFRIIESIKGKEISYLWQELITTFSIIFLVVLTIHATINDLLRMLT